MKDSLKYEIAVTLVKGFGNKLVKNLIAYVGSPEAIFRESERGLSRIPGIGQVLSSGFMAQREEVLARAEKEIEFINKNGISCYYYLDDDYPYRLKECADAPVVFFSKGTLDLNEGKFIGVVGTRKPTDTGRENVRMMIEDIARSLPDVMVVSGLAYGIDICAHRASLDFGLPTVGVLGHGLDRIYPGVHRQDARRMCCEAGGLVTEFLSGTNPDKPNFVKRNRIIAGLCDALVVVESSSKGGALITADMANDYNRDVFAFPGRVKDEFSVGCNRLIKQNKAMLIESADDVLHAMNWTVREEKPREATSGNLFEDLSEEENVVLTELCKYTDGIHVNELAALLSMPFSRVSSLLLAMEFRNIVKCYPGNVYRAVR